MFSNIDRTAAGGTRGFHPNRRPANFFSLSLLLFVALAPSFVSSFVALPLGSSSSHCCARILRSSSSSESSGGESSDGENNFYGYSCDDVFGEEKVTAPLEFDAVKNARDIATVKRSCIKSGRIFRTGMLSNASSEDRMKILNDISLKTLVDLRSLTELKTDEGLYENPMFEGYTDIKWSSVRSAREVSTQEKYDGSSEKNFRRKERHFVSLMDEKKYVLGTLKRLEKRKIAKLAITAPSAVVSKRMRKKAKASVLETINDGGLPMLNELILEMAAKGISYVLNLCADVNRHPLAFYCTAGKDRTGVVTAIILAACGVEDSAIVEDYAISANVYKEMGDHKAMVGALQQRDLNPDVFLGAPAEVMVDTLATIRGSYGSIDGYLDYIGFGEDDRERLRRALMAD